jgi:1-acyl-sn-glycerol-3-phosphate acyltransferase
MEETTLPRRGAFARFSGRFLCWLFGWRFEGELPTYPKAIFIACPHTTNWDGVIMCFVSYALGIRLSFLTKKEVMWGPLKWIVPFFDGIPIDRHKSHNLVATVADQFQASEGMYLAIAPKGTRKKTSHWRSGFYHMARQANVPLILGYLDYKRKVGGLGPRIDLTGDVKADMDRIRAFYKDITPRHPELIDNIVLRDELESDPANLPPITAGEGREAV